MVNFRLFLWKAKSNKRVREGHTSATERSISSSERRLVKLDITRILKELSVRYLLREYGQFFVASVVGGSIFGFFANYPWYFGTLGGVIFSAILFPIVKFERGREFSLQVKRLRQALTLDRAYITEVSATGYASFQEFEDLGAFFVFQVEPDKLFVLRGQDYYETQRFPCLNFEIVSIPNALFVVRPLSQKIGPDLEFDDKTMLTVCSIDDQFILNGTISDVLQVLRANLA